MKPVVAVIAPGNMGAAVGGRLVERGLKVLTSLQGRSEASITRARVAGLTAASDEELAGADIFLSIVPPAQALPLAQQMAPLIAAKGAKTVYVDCNAVNPDTAARIGAVIARVGAPFVDAGIIGGPPSPKYDGPVLYASGPHAHRFAALAQFGLKVRVLGGADTAASALKMSYAGITKGVTALGAAMMLAAMRAGVGDELHRELAASQPALFPWLSRQIPAMYPKAYRWIAEMEEIAGFVGADAAAAKLYRGAADFYAQIAEDVSAGRRKIETLDEFLAPRDRPKSAAKG